MLGPHRSLAVTTLLALLILVSVPNVHANDSVGVFGASFLSVPVGARTMALPDVVAGIRPDASVMFANPSRTSDIGSREIFFSTATWLDELNLSAASLVIPSRQHGITFSLGTRLLYSGGLQGFDTGGNVVEESSYYDLGISAGLSKQLGLGLALGGGATYVREAQPAQAGSAVLFSAGASWQRGPHRVDVYAADFGGELKFDDRNYPIESRVVFGYGHTLDRAWGMLDFGAELTATRSDERRIDIGAAYHLNQFVTVRSGAFHNFNGSESSQMPITAGLGFEYNAFAIDYAYTAQEFFPATHTFSLVYAFGQSTMPTSASGPPPVTPVQSQPVRTVPSTTGMQQPQSRMGQVTYLLVGGLHSRLESARAEVRALRLLNVPAVTEKTGDRFRVIIGRYDTLEEANRAANSFLKNGHRFEIIHEQS